MFCEEITRDKPKKSQLKQRITNVLNVPEPERSQNVFSIKYVSIYLVTSRGLLSQLIFM